MNLQCDDERLIDLLQSDDDESTSGTAEHIEHCSYCQSRIELLAAEPCQWQLARDIVASSQRIEASGSQVDGSVAGDDLFRREWSQRRTRFTNWTESMSKTLLDPPSHPEMLGRIGRYDVERLIGSGGMGVVFKAYDTELNRPVAVKLLAPYLAENGSARKRFAREARAAAAVVDEHVVAIHNVESSEKSSENPNDVPFLVMKYIAGGSLQQRLDRDGPLDVCEILRIGMQTARGLAAAHAQGLIHRDVKPSNILLEEGVDRALLTDFGLARAEDDASLTRSGFHPGTPHYMSPEQVRGETIDARSDLFSLGCVLYALCTGHPPFRAETSYAVLRRITDDIARPIREINSSTPAWLEKIVMKLLSKSRADRFGSAEEVAELLEGCLAHIQHPTTTPLPTQVAGLSARGSGNPPWIKYIAAAAGALAFALAGILILLELNKGTLRIECSVDDVPIRIVQGGEVVKELTVTQSGKSVRVAAGKYVIEIDGEFTGVEVLGSTVSLSRGGMQIIKIEKSSDDHSLEKMQETDKAASTNKPTTKTVGPAAPNSIIANASPLQISMAQQAFDALRLEHDKFSQAYSESIDQATDEIELNRVYDEMDPREIMTPKYMIFEEAHRGTSQGLKALIQVAAMAQSVANPNLIVAKGRVEAVDRIIAHYLGHEGLESIARTFGGGPFVPRADEFLQALVEKSPYAKTRAEALIQQIKTDKLFLSVETQIPSLRKQLAEFPSGSKYREFREQRERFIAKLEGTDFRQLRRDTNEKLDRLADNYRNLKVDSYDSGGEASQRLSHAINKVIIGKPAPELAATDINGKPFRLSEYRGKIVVLMFTNAAFDRDYSEMYGPMRQLVARYKSSPIRVVGIMGNNDEAKLRAAFDRGELNWTVIPAPLNGPLYKDWGIEGYPSVYIIDHQGTLHPEIHMPYHGAGGYDTKDVVDKLDELLRAKYRSGESANDAE